jgi:hypothetical protein
VQTRISSYKPINQRLRGITVAKQLHLHDDNASFGASVKAAVQWAVLLL